MDRDRSLLCRMFRRVVPAMLAVWAFALPAQADTKTWTGAVNGLWSTAGNWAGGVPAGGDTLVFPQTAANRSNTNDFSAGTVFTNITFLGDGYTISGNAIGLSSGIANGTYPSACCVSNDITLNIALAAPVTISGYGGILTVSGAIALGPHLLTIDDGTSTIVTGVISGSGGVRTVRGQQNCCSEIRLSANNTYTGPTTHDSWYFNVNGSQPSSAVTMSSNGFRLGGRGTIGVLSAAREVWPGSALNTSAGALSTGSASFNGGSRLVIDLNGPTPGTGYDQLRVSGTVTIASSVSLQVNLNTGASLGQQFVIVDNDGADAVAGTFSGLPQGATIDTGGSKFTISYVGGTGNDVVLTCTVPSRTWTGAVSGLWSDPGNWIGGAPVAGDVLMFPATAANKANTNDLPAGTVFGGIGFTGGGYTLGGNAFGLSGGIVNGSQAAGGWTNRIDNDIALAAPITHNGYFGTLTLGGALNLGPHQLTLDVQAGIIVSGVISGTGGVRTQQSFTCCAPIVLSGNNTYSGSTTLPIGYVQINGTQPASPVNFTGYRLGGAGAMGPLTATSEIRPGEPNSITSARLGTGNLALNSGARLFIDLLGGAPGSGYDQLAVAGTVSIQPGAALSVVTALGPAAGQEFVIIDNDSTDGVIGTFNGLPEGATVSAGPFRFRLSYVGGTGNDVTLTSLTSASSWTGAVNPLWSNPGNWSDGNVPEPGDVLVFPSVASNRANQNDLAVQTYGGLVFYGSGYTISGNAISLSGAVTNGTAAACCGDNRVDAPLQLAAPIALRGYGGRLNVAGPVALGAHDLMLDGSTEVRLSGIVSGTGGVRIARDFNGTCCSELQLSGNNTYTGPTTMTEGYAHIDGLQPASPVSVTGYRFGGRGTVGALTITTELWPGGVFDNSAGILTTGNLALNSGSRTTLHLNGAIPGTSHDQLNVAGSMTIGLNATLIPSLTFTPARGQIFVIVNNDGTDAVGGTFQGLPEGATVNLGPYPFQISYVGKTGNDITLTSLSGDPLNQAPAAVDDAYDGFSDVPLTIDAPGVLANDSDADGDTVTVVSWPATTSQGGTVSGNADGSFTYTPAPGFVGTDTFTYVISDGRDATDTATVTLTVAQSNRAPVATDDTYATSEDTPLTVSAPGVLGNDTDADGDTLSVTVVSGPSHGVLTLNGDGSFGYLPAPNYYGSDSFTYQAADPDGLTDQATVAIGIASVNDPPAMGADSYSATEDTPLDVTAPGVLANDSDPDGDALSAAVLSGPAHGTLTLNADGSFSYSPAANYNGADGFTYEAADGQGGTVPATVTLSIAAANDAPTAQADSYATDEDTPLTVAGPGVLGNDSDLDSDTLTAAVVSGPAHGTLTLAADGSFTYTPAADYHGPDSFTYSASDGQGGSAEGMVAIDVAAVNDPPVAAADAYAVTEGQRLTVAAPGVLGNDTDADGDALTVSVVTAPAHGTLALAADGSFTYDADAGYRGGDSFVYHAADAQAGDDATVTLTIGGSTDLSVVIADSPDPQRPGGTVTYTITVSNLGPSFASDVTLSDTLPAGQPLAPVPSQGSCVGQVDSFTCQLGSMASGASATVSVSVAVQNPGILTNTATVAGVDPDPVSANDTAQESTTIGMVSASPDTLVKRVDFGGGSGTAPLTLSNLSPNAFDYQLQELDPPAASVGDGRGGTDVPWLSLNPSAGSIPAMSSEEITAGFDASGLTPGLRRALVHVDESSPFDVEDVAVCFTVGYTDVPVDAFAEAHVHALAGAGVTGGCGPGLFCPDARLSRAAMAVWLLRSKEGPAYVPPPATGTVFADVPVDGFAANYIEELQRRAITTGCGGGNFCPDAPVTREELAVFLLRTLEGPAYTPPDATGVFADVPVTSAFARWVEELARRGITSGCGGGNFCPHVPTPRAQTAVFDVVTFSLPMCGQ